MEQLREQILSGLSREAEQYAGELLQAGTRVRDILAYAIEGAMDRLSEKCAMEQYNLLEIMLAGRAAMTVMKLICSREDFRREEAKGAIVVASLRGDVHDLGKNILKMALEARGYTVVDCGKDCPLERLVTAVAEHVPLAVGISGLISTVVPAVRQVRGALRAHDEALASIPLMAGGAALKQLSSEQLQVDYVAQNVFDGVDFVEGLQKRK